MATQLAAELALQAHTEALMSNPNVSYAAVVEEDGEYIIEVGVYSVDLEKSLEALSETGELEMLNRIPAFLEIAATDLAGSQSDEEIRVPVKLVESLPIVAQYTNRNRPAAGGDSIGNYKSNSAGTLGAAITISTRPGKIYLITNWHVLVGSFGNGGDSVLQQGFLDGGRHPSEWIASLDFSTISSKVDLAIAEVRAPYSQFVTVGITRCFGQITGVNYNPAIGSAAKKCGRTTNGTTGTVRSANASVRVGGYPTGTITFTNQILLTNMSRPGDSGSIVLDSNNKAIGLLFAGDGSTTTIANRFDEVERALPRGSVKSDLSTVSIGFELTAV